MHKQEEAVGTPAGRQPVTVQSPTYNQAQVNRNPSANVVDEYQGPCKDAVTQLELNECAAKEFRKADAELNKVYNHILSSLNQKNQSNLREAQRAWVVYRDANCSAEADYHGGSMAPMIYSFCLKENTTDRIKELRRIYEGDRN